MYRDWWLVLIIKFPSPNWGTTTTVYTGRKRSNFFCWWVKKKETDNLYLYFILFFFRVGGDFWCGHTEDIRRRRAYVMRCWLCLRRPQTPKVNVNARLSKEKTRERTLWVHVSNDVLTSVRPSVPSARWAPVPISCPTPDPAAASLSQL